MKWIALSTLLLCVFMSGCLKVLEPQPDPTRFYVLRPIAEQLDTPNEGKGAIIVMPVIVPSYLDRPQMANEAGDFEISYREFDRWAEPLDNALPRVVAVNIGNLIGDEHAHLFTKESFEKNKYDAYLFIEILRFEATRKGHVKVHLKWRLTDSYNQNTIYSSVFAKEIECNVGKSNSVAQAYSKALADFSQEVVSKQ